MKKIVLATTFAMGIALHASAAVLPNTVDIGDAGTRKEKASGVRRAVRLSSPKFQPSCRMPAPRGPGILPGASFQATQSAKSSVLAVMPPDPYGIVAHPIPDKTVVLSFDDSVASHATVVAPLLKKLGFGGSFYICDFDSFSTRKDWYMTWSQIKSLADDGFDVGNHTKGHGGASIDAWLNLETEFAANHVPKPTTLCWPVYAVYPYEYPELIAHQYTFGRAGGNRPYRPTLDHPLNVPSWGIQDDVSLETFISYVQQANGGQIAVFTFHGVPEGEHKAVSLAPEKFSRMMQYLKDKQFNVIGMRDLAKYVDVKKADKFLPAPNQLPWGGMTRDGNTLYVSVSKLPADRKLTLPGMTTRIARAYFAGDAKKQPLTITKADTGIQTLVVPESYQMLSGEFPTVIVAELQGAPIATILDFAFPGAPPTVISGNEIRAQVPLAADLTKLSPVYDTGSPQVKGHPASGSTHNFSKPQTYIITAADGSIRRYLVSVTPTLGAVAIGNPGFETSASANDGGDSKSGAAAWTLIKPRNDGELGIRDLVEAPSAPRPPDGSRHAVYMRGPGNGVSQTLTFDKGNYILGFDAVKRNGYEKTAAPIKVTLDGTLVLTLEPSQISEKWAHYTSPAFPVTAGSHTLAITLGEGDGMDLIDNVTLQR